MLPKYDLINLELKIMCEFSGPLRLCIVNAGCIKRVNNSIHEIIN